MEINLRKEDKYSFHDARWYWDKEAREYKFMPRGIRILEVHKDWKTRDQNQRYYTDWICPDRGEPDNSPKGLEITKVSIEQSLRQVCKMTETPMWPDEDIAIIVALWHTVGPKATAVKPGTEYGDRKPDEDDLGDDLDDDFKEEE